MVELSCSSCSNTMEVPPTLTVVEEELENGWELSVEVRGDHLIVEDAYCESCQVNSEQQ